jgi:hypothetical protein
VIVVEKKKKVIMKSKKYSKEHDKMREDQIALLFLYCFDLLGEFNRYTSGEIRAMLYEMEDAIK